MKCFLVKDLLPNYIDGLTGEETGREIREHLETCADCRAVYEQMSAVILEEVPPEEKNIDFMKDLKTRMRRRYTGLALSACALFILLLGSLAIFARHHRIPLPYDPEYMTAEIYQAAEIVNEYGNSQWLGLDALDFEDSRAVIQGEKDTIDLVQLVQTGPLRCDDISSRSRTIQRDGETVRVVYYCYTRTLWNDWFPGRASFLDWSVTTATIYEGLELYQAGHTPMEREIYYLPMGDMSRLDRLSDEAFDARKKDAVLVWKGVI